MGQSCLSLPPLNQGEGDHLVTAGVLIVPFGFLLSSLTHFFCVLFSRSASVSPPPENSFVETLLNPKSSCIQNDNTGASNSNSVNPTRLLVKASSQGEIDLEIDPGINLLAMSGFLIKSACMSS